MRRGDKEILDATRPFAVENAARSWFHVITTFALAALLAAGAALAPWLAARIGCSVVLGLTLVRLFILFHDFYHGAILRGSRVARALFWSYGLFVLTPPRVWRETHNYHHAHNGKIVGSHVGSYPVVTTAMWAGMSPVQRFGYRAARHPLTIALGTFTVFAWGMCVSPFLRDRRKNATALLALALQVGLAYAVIHFLGFTAYLLTLLLPMMVAMAAGAYLFYAQHNFPGVHFQPRDQWNYVRAALESSSYMTMGPVLTYFTGSIGFHHVHHLNPSIPFYRLREAMDGIPELSAPRTTSLRPADVLACLRLAIWDTARAKMVPWPEAGS
jgi:omega-6 fatty acid desaturase (delta-12 desaturase)